MLPRCELPFSRNTKSEEDSLESFQNYTKKQKKMGISRKHNNTWTLHNEIWIPFSILFSQPYDIMLITYKNCITFSITLHYSSTFNIASVDKTFIYNMQRYKIILHIKLIHYIKKLIELIIHWYSIQNIWITDHNSHKSKDGTCIDIFALTQCTWRFFIIQHGGSVVVVVLF